ncbi:MAG: RNA polymerase sigma factor, partial [Gammaproteobacteria bacterium]|nr:RNA polymerase sigma factor [Gammaproteobacteria bacterium]
MRSGHPFSSPVRNMNKLSYIGIKHVSPAVQALHGSRVAAQPEDVAEREHGEPLLRKPEGAADQNAALRQPELDKQLLLLLTAEPLKGLASIYDQYAGLVYGLARAILMNTQEAEDLTQETYLKAFQSFASLRSVDSIRPWLFQILSRLATDRYRSTRREVPLDEAGEPDRFSLYNQIADEDPFPYSNR